jgi:hypothetical protein
LGAALAATALRIPVVAASTAATHPSLGTLVFGAGAWVKAQSQANSHCVLRFPRQDFPQKIPPFGQADFFSYLSYRSPISLVRTGEAEVDEVAFDSPAVRLKFGFNKRANGKEIEGIFTSRDLDIFCHCV